MEVSGDVHRVVTFRFSRIVSLLALGCFVWLSTTPVRADQIVLAPAWDVSGTLSIVGNNACSGLPCTETVAFSFDLGYEFFPDVNTYEAYIANVTENWSGDLGSFHVTTTGPQRVNASQNIFGFADPADDEIDINIIQGFVSTPPVTPSFVGATLYTCGTTTCLTDFAPSLFQGRTPPQFGILVGGPAEFTVTPTPEPATLTLLVCGLFILGLAGATCGKICVPNAA
jgi:hypothetical protein